MSDSLSEFRNSEGLTPADSWRKTADEVDREAAVHRGMVANLTERARRYHQMADEWEREHLGREWADLRAGDVITLRVFDHQEGWHRERRTVVAVDWPIITFRDGSREYDYDCSQGQQLNRDLRLVPSDA